MGENIVRHKGLDLFFFKPETNTQFCECKVCGSDMDGEKNVLTPTSFAEAMARSNSEQDVFTCPNSCEEWHQQALALRMEADKTASAKITDLINDEIEVILIFKKVTKKDWKKII